MREVLVTAYSLFALAAGARSAVQIGTRFDEAELAYLLSAVAAAVYLVLAVAVSRRGTAARRVVLVGCAVELAGVLGVGVLSVARPDLFADATVWSKFGQGYGFIPLALPVAGLCWLAMSRSVASRTAPA